MFGVTELGCKQMLLVLIEHLIYQNPLFYPVKTSVFVCMQHILWMCLFGTLLLQALCQPFY